MKQLITLTFIVAVMTGCAHTASQQDGDQKTNVLIAGKQYPVDEHGFVRLGKHDVYHIKNKGGVLVSDPREHHVLSAEEYELLHQYPEAGYSLLGKPSQQQAFLVRKGSLEENLHRLVRENGWEKVVYDAMPYHMSDPRIVKAQTMEEAVDGVHEDLPVFVCVDEEHKVVTVIDGK